MGVRCFVEALLNAEGEMRGEGAELVSGQRRVYPAGTDGASTTRNDSDVTAVCSLKK